MSDYCTLKQYGKLYKLTYFKVPIRQRGFELTHHSIKCSVNEEKLSCNLSRAKSRVYEYALCNDFEYFVTLTINKEKYDRYDLKKYYKDLGLFIKNYGRLHHTKVSYLLIPEQHLNGAWHMHGLVSGIPESELLKFSLEDNIPSRIKELIRDGRTIYNWQQYASKFGWVTLEKVKSKERVSRYITKYINKALETTIKELGAHAYYCSQGLKKSVEVKRGPLSANNVPFQFENDYVKIKWFNNDSCINYIETI